MNTKKNIFIILEVIKIKKETFFDDERPYIRCTAPTFNLTDFDISFNNCS